MWSSAPIVSLQERIKDIIIITWLRNASEKLSHFSREAHLHRANKKRRVLPPIPGLKISPLANHSS
jgi:hypothetical protein